MNNELNTDTFLNDLAALERAIKDIRKNKATWKKYLKARKEGRVTDDQVANAKAVLTDALKDSLAIAIERGFCIAQGDEQDWDARAENIANEMISE